MNGLFHTRIASPENAEPEHLALLILRVTFIFVELLILNFWGQLFKRVFQSASTCFFHKSNVNFHIPFLTGLTDIFYFWLILFRKKKYLAIIIERNFDIINIIRSKELQNVLYFGG